MTKLKSVKDFAKACGSAIANPGNAVGLGVLMVILGSCLGYILNIVKFLTIDFGAEATNEVFIRLIGMVSPLGIPLGFM